MALNAQHAYWYIGLIYRTMNKEFGPIYAVERGDKKQCVRGEKSWKRHHFRKTQWLYTLDA